jgi:prepilin-type N-terminal cleavage/methylation domain-containing protein
MKQMGMTLTEIMVVVIIMALISTAVAAAVIPAIQKAKIQATQNDVRVVRGAAQRWMTENAGCPAFEELTLDAGARQLDVWDHPFAIECDGSGPIVSSRGPDGDAGTDDDIQVPGPRRGG